MVRFSRFHYDNEAGDAESALGNVLHSWRRYISLEMCKLSLSHHVTSARNVKGARLI
jgi:hypothetical protein